MPPLESEKPNRNPVTLVIVFVVLIVLAFIMFGKNKTTVTPPPENTNPAVTKENVTVIKTNAGQVPSGFPTLIPVETKTIIFADTKIYTDRSTPVTLYTVNYTSSKSVSEKYNEYLSFMTKEGYMFGENGKDEKNHALYGTSGNDSLLVTINKPEGGQTVVQLSYTEVK